LFWVDILRLKYSYNYANGKFFKLIFFSKKLYKNTKDLKIYLDDWWVPKFLFPYVYKVGQLMIGTLGENYNSVRQLIKNYWNEFRLGLEHCYKEKSRYIKPRMSLRKKNQVKYFTKYFAKCIARKSLKAVSILVRKDCSHLTPFLVHNAQMFSCPYMVVDSLRGPVWGKQSTFYSAAYNMHW